MREFRRGVLAKMPLGTWRAIVAAGLVLAALLGGGSAYLHYLYHEQHRVYATATDQTEQADNDVSSGPFWLVSEWNRFVYGQDVSEAEKRKENRERHDLMAQQEMAEWAFWLLCTSIFSIFISIGGFVLLIISLWQTRVAIRDNREIGEAQTRAYVGASNGSLRVYGDGTYGILATIKNSGQSPAINVEIVAKDDIHIYAATGEEPKTSMPESRMALTGDDATTILGDLGPSSHIDDAVLAMREQKLPDPTVANTIVFVFWVRYRTVFTRIAKNEPEMNKYIAVAPITEQMRSAGAAGALFPVHIRAIRRIAQQPESASG